MATIIEEFVAKLRWDVDDDNVKEFSKQMNTVADMAKKAAVAIAGATAAAVGFAVITNKQTAINANLAKSVGLSAESYDAWDSIMQQLGFDGEKVIDLVEEMNNKLGELKGLGEFISAEESLQILGLRFKEIKDLAPEEQFLKIMSTAKGMADQQKAVSAVDMLMGGEANRVLGFLRTMDGDLEDIVERRMQLNLLDREAREGAIRFTASWMDFTHVMRSIGAQFSGLLGEVLTPMINEFIRWVTANREILKTRLRTFVEQLASAIKFIVPHLRDFVMFVGNLVESLGGLGNVGRLIATIFTGKMFASAALGLASFMKATKQASASKGIFKALAGELPDLSTAVGIGLALIAEDLWNFYQGNESVAGKVSATLEEFIGASIEFFGQLFGIPKEDLDKMLVDMDNTVRTWIPKIFDFIIQDFREFITNWKTFFNFLWDDLKSLGRIAKRFFGLTGGEGVGATGGNRSPLIGPVPTAFGGPPPTNAAGAINNSNRTNNVNVNSPITMQLPPGMSAEDVARQVKKELDRAAGWAVDTNDTGVVY